MKKVKEEKNVFYLLYKEDGERLERIIQMFNTTIKNVLDQVESNTEKFYEMTAKMQIKHFENLEKHTAKLLKLLEQKPAPVMEEKPIRLEELDSNEIDKEEIREDQFNEDNHVPIIQGLNVQFEGEEKITPINIE